MENENAILEIEQPRFDRNRFRVYYGNIGEIIAQEVLRKQGFEAYMTRPIASKDYIFFLVLPKWKVDDLRRHYDAMSPDYKEKVTWKQYLKDYRERFTRETEKTKAFFGNKRAAFEKYLSRLETESIEYRWDLLAKKSDKIYVIEVKSTKRALRFLKGEKLKGLMLAREFGFTPAIISIDIKIEATNFKMAEIS